MSYDGLLFSEKDAVQTEIKYMPFIFYIDGARAKSVVCKLISSFRSRNLDPEA